MDKPITQPPQTLKLIGETEAGKRLELKQYFNQTWALYESLFDLIQEDSAYYLKAEPLRHPLIFYFGHTATFYINKLKLGKFLDERVNDNFESMFAIGVDEMSWDDLNEQHYPWPNVAEVRSYRQQVNAVVNRVIDEMPLALPITQDSPAWIILMGIEHERIHLETSSVIIRQLPLEHVAPNSLWAACQDFTAAEANSLLAVKGQKVTLGKNEQDETYGWDNEYGHKIFNVADFKASKFLVSNQEYLAFVEAGGYRSPQFWNEEGQAWLAYT
ncbi:MAG TPA: SAM-dependent methyltransferase, partial [Shewanella baltica]|nr:SAM-dependent methyltransferase [Shewanella baltica]